MPSESRIDFALIQAIVGQFPDGSWQRVHGSDIHTPTDRNHRARKWVGLQHVHKKGGVYAFLFPVVHFSGERCIELDGPARCKIPFCFNAQNHPLVEGLFLAYVGKAANLRQRFQWHFGGSKISTAAQVRNGLMKSRICTDLGDAVDFMHKHATIMYYELSGQEQTANRDLLELSLCAKFAPPFNIKSER